jgi:hypothetical protein
MNVRMNHFLPALKEKFPELEEDTLKKIIKTGCAKIHDAIINGNDVNLENKKIPVKMLFYKPNYKKGKNRKRKK